MKLYIKQQVFTIRTKFNVWDATGEPKYFVEGEIFTFGRKLHVYDKAGKEVIFIKQRLFTFLPKYTVTTADGAEFTVRKDFTFIRHRYTIPEMGIEINGNFLAHEYAVTRSGVPVARMSKQWLTWGDTYELDISESEDELCMLAAILVVDCCMAAANTAAAS